MKGHTASWAINAIAVSAHRERIVSASSDGTARVWTAATPPQTLVSEKEENDADLHLTALSKERDSAAAAERDARACLNVGTDDGAKIYLNGTEIYRRDEARSYVRDQDIATGLELKGGLNVLVFKMAYEGGDEDWRGSIRLSDAAGQPLKGIRTTLTPEAK